MNKVLEIDVKSLRGGLESKEICLIDVRERIENAEEKIEGSVLMPLSSFDPAKVLSIKENKKLVLHCRSGKRSLKAAEQLIENGCLEVYSLKGGIKAWKENGYDIQKSQNVPISLMRQVQIAAGLLVLIGIILSIFVQRELVYLSAFVGAGLVFAGITNTCALGMLLAKMPWNQTK
jgi:rhodanese-related sulfurtransferase